MPTQVSGDQVGRELDAAERGIQSIGQRPDGQRLGEPGHALEQQVAAGEQRDEDSLEHRVLAHDDAPDLEQHRLGGGARISGLESREGGGRDGHGRGHGRRLVTGDVGHGELLHRSGLRVGGPGAERHGHLAGLAVPEHVDRDGLAGLTLAQHHVERVSPVERGAVDGGEDVAGLEPGLLGGAAGDDHLSEGRGSTAQGVGILVERIVGVDPLTVRALAAERRGIRDPRAVGDRQAGLLLDGGGDGLEPEAQPRARELLPGRRLGEEGAGDVDRDGEADALAGARDGGVDADDRPGRVEQRATTVAGVDGGVGLDQVGQRARCGVDAAAHRRDDPARDRVRELAQRAADGDRLLAHLDRRRVADRCGRETGRVDLDDGEVGEGVDAVDGRVEGTAVLEMDGELRRVARHDVVVGEDQAVRVEDDARAGGRAGARHARHRVGLGDAVRDDRDDGRADGLDDVDDGRLAAGGCQRDRGRGRRARGRRGGCSRNRRLGRLGSRARRGGLEDRRLRRGRASRARRVHGDVGAAGCQDGCREDGADDHSGASRTTRSGGTRRGGGRLGRGEGRRGAGGRIGRPGGGLSTRRLGRGEPRRRPGGRRGGRLRDLGGSRSGPGRDEWLGRRLRLHRRHGGLRGHRLAGLGLRHARLLGLRIVHE